MLGSQLGAAFGATGVDHCATTTSSHTGAKTVSAGTLQFAGLKSSFHFDIPVMNVSELFYPTVQQRENAFRKGGEY